MELSGRKGLAFLHCTVLGSMSLCLVEGRMMGVSGSFSFTSLTLSDFKILNVDVSTEISDKFVKSCQLQCLIELCIKKANQKNGPASDGQHKYISERSS